MSILLDADTFEWLRADTATWLGFDPWALDPVPADWTDATLGDVVPLHLGSGRDLGARCLWRAAFGVTWLGPDSPQWELAMLVGTTAAWRLSGVCFSSNAGPDGVPWQHIPSLAAVNPYDGTTLPDGSRQVDADALLVALGAY